MKAQRTPLEAYQHVLARYKAGKLGAVTSGGSCVYQEEGVDKDVAKNCAVGCLFTQEQLDDIAKRNLNRNAGVGRLSDMIGRDNIECVTGLKLGQLIELQNKHDQMFDRHAPEVTDGFETFLLNKINIEIGL